MSDFQVLTHLALLQSKMTLSDSYPVATLHNMFVRRNIVHVILNICIYLYCLYLYIYIYIDYSRKLFITIKPLYTHVICIYLYIEYYIWRDIYMSSDTSSCIAATLIPIILARRLGRDPQAGHRLEG